MKNIYTKGIIGLLVFTPFISFAAGKTLKDIVDLVVSYLNVGLFLIVSFAFVTFVWNVYRYFFTEKDKTEAGMYVLYSVIGFVVILTFWGIVAVVRNTLNLDNTRPANIPVGFDLESQSSNSGKISSGFQSTGSGVNPSVQYNLNTTPSKLGVMQYDNPATQNSANNTNSSAPLQQNPHFDPGSISPGSSNL